MPAALAFLAALGAAMAAGWLSWWWALWYLCAGAATFAVYAADKAAATEHARRVPERTLHLLGLAGGWPGAALARALLRHKSRKQPFRAVFWMTAAANAAGMAALGFLLH